MMDINKEFTYTKSIEIEENNTKYVINLNFYYTYHNRKISFKLISSDFTSNICVINQIKGVTEWYKAEINWYAWRPQNLYVTSIVGSVLIIASDIACDMVNHELVKEAYQHGEVLGE